jgi:hypothetical protein
MILSTIRVGGMFWLALLRAFWIEVPVPALLR